MHIIFLFLAFFLTIEVAQGQGRAAAVIVEIVEERELSETVSVFAEVVTARDGSVANRVVGNVDKVHVLVGTQVEEGDLLVELNRELLEIVVAQSEAQLVEAKASVEAARTRVDQTASVFTRFESLRDSAAFSEARFDIVRSDMLEARSQLAGVEARVKISEANLAESQYRLNRSQIRAPFSGVVLEVNTIPGAYLQAGSPVVRLVDTNALEVQASVATRYIVGLTSGLTVAASTDTGADLPLQLRAILPLENPSTRTRSVRFTAVDSNALANLAVGQSITVQIPVGAARTMLSVPKDALVQARGGWTVFVAQDDKAQSRTVEIGIAIGDRYEVLSGLGAGDLVVVRGNERLRPDQDIAATPLETN